MPYKRVIPRDLFNEADLLKCYGRLALLLNGNRRAHVGEDPDDAYESFEIVQNWDDGSLTIENLPLMLHDVRHRLYRPLNARSAWPLYVEVKVEAGTEEIRVFDEDGNPTSGFENLLKDKR